MVYKVTTAWAPLLLLQRRAVNGFKEQWIDSKKHESYRGWRPQHLPCMWMESLFCARWWPKDLCLLGLLLVFGIGAFEEPVSISTRVSTFLLEACGMK